jgi:cathepsin A (carboxypeptidase C)
MKVLFTILTMGAAAVAVAPSQQIIGLPKDDVEAVHQPLENIREHLKTLSDEARDLWNDIFDMFPDEVAGLRFPPVPKSYTRRPDSYWDHIVRGSDVQSAWVTGENGQKEREVYGKLESYDLRVKKVDPSALGVDPDVKQYSGYLDDDENDKHLFYCEQILKRANQAMKLIWK